MQRALINHFGACSFQVQINIPILFKGRKWWLRYYTSSKLGFLQVFLHSLVLPGVAALQ